MKKWIIVGIVVMLFGCAKSEEDKCKDEGKYWDVSAKECKDKAPEGTPAPVAETQETCKTKAGHVWNAESSQCKKVDYFMLIRPEDNDLRNVYVGLKADNNRRESSVYMQKGDCVKVSGSYLPNVMVRIQSSSFSIGWDVVCSGFAESATKCELGIYELALDDDDGVVLQSVTMDTERTNCKLLELNN